MAYDRIASIVSLVEKCVLQAIVIYSSVAMETIIHKGKWRGWGNETTFLVLAAGWLSNLSLPCSQEKIFEVVAD